MKLLLTGILILGLSVCRGQAIKKLHSKSVVVDTHNDVLSSAVLDGLDISHRIPEGHSDLDRWKEGGLDVQFFSVWTGDKPRNKEGFYKDALQEIDSLNILLLKNPTRMALAFNFGDVRKGLRQNKLVSLVGVEGGHMIEDDLNKLESLAKLGMRYMTLTWNNSTSWASSAMDETLRPDSLKQKGLNEFGKQVVRKMNELGVIVDLSHTGEQTFYDALAVTDKPVILSHSSVWTICPVFRNVKDEQIKAIAKNNGVICINFFSGFIDSNFYKRMEELQGTKGQQIRDSLQEVTKNSGKEFDAAKMNEIWRKYFSAELEPLRPTLAQMVDHIDHIVKIAGVDHVGIGSDFDGVSSLPKGLEDVTTYPRITEELKRRGYTDKEIKKILGENVLRVMKANFR